MNSVAEIVLDCIGKYGHVDVVMYAVNPIALFLLLKLRKRNDIEVTAICPELLNLEDIKKVKNELKKIYF